MNTSNKRLKIGASFPGFYLIFLTPRLARLSLLTPCLTLARASQQNTCLFHPTDGESHPSRLRASISSQVTASASRPPNFTFLSSPVRQRVLISRRTPARASRPDNLTFSTPRPTYLSVFTCPTQRAWSSRQTPARASRPDNFTFSNLLLNEAHPSDTAISKPVGRRQEPLQPDNLTFHVPRSARLTCPTRRLPKPTSARASQPDNSSFPSARTTIRTPPNATHSTVQTTLAFSPPLARFHHPTHEYQSHIGSRKSLPAGQPHLFSYVSEANPSNRWARPPVGCRLSIPTILYLSVFTCPTQWASISRRLPARASRPDNLAFSSPTLATLIRPTQRVCAPIGRRREPHS